MRCCATAQQMLVGVGRTPEGSSVAGIISTGSGAGERRFGPGLRTSAGGSCASDRRIESPDTGVCKSARTLSPAQASCLLASSATRGPTVRRVSRRTEAGASQLRRSASESASLATTSARMSRTIVLTCS